MIKMVVKAVAERAHSVETKIKMSIAKRGRSTAPRSQEIKKKISDSLKNRIGRKQTPESIAKMLATRQANQNLS